jgi:putative sterol carrier protein
MNGREAQGLRKAKMDQTSLARALERSLQSYGPLDGSVWLCITDLGQVRVERNGALACDDGNDCDATITVHRDHFERIVEGKLDPISALMSGKVRIKGSLAAAGRLARILGKAREDGVI